MGKRYLLGMRDLTDLKDLERRREEFLAIVSHDLRTPLTSLKGFVELLLNDEHDPGSQVSRYLKIIDMEADRMIALINDLLDLDRFDSQKIRLDLSTVPLPDVVAYAVKGMEGMARQREVQLRVMTEGDEEGLLVDVDRRRLLQALMNLYANAIRFSPRGGRVDTVIGRGEGRVTVRILDEGPGIPQEDRERIFEKYHQVDQPSPERIKGSGLGLTIVRRIMDLHGGAVRLDNREEEQGSCFLIELPAADGGKS